ncbi:MAG: hypothetical protein A3H51_02945 [Candidatus Spechtbacteria bacterium RIFCSPLOWO2_02_FULL_38_8]|uniref:Uncharacterized protein n=1 Tax=Candidatus Spechtbacteria bacterium RIFCSPLOWO2_02_FULL_38_8 TaxID=1802164 RepID=A0A1G2HI21_9BACT|nr:MAG: hypothetical protein A3H51_02945 [Candidatus Spechtbacteria bacterium RIFCSPLOWO2_02_FULL_38_8]
MNFIKDNLKNKLFLWLILVLIILYAVLFVDFSEIFHTVKTDRQLKDIAEDGLEKFDADSDENFDIDVTEFENEDFVELNELN